MTGGILQMKAQQKTFSVSLSRDMMPEAHIVVWHVYKGEVITDSLNFFVNGTRLNKVQLAFIIQCAQFNIMSIWGMSHFANVD